MKSLEVYKIQTDYSILHYAAERGFWYSFSAFLLSAAIDTRLKWDDSRRFAPQIWDQYNDLLPALNFLNLGPTGVTYASVSYLIPLSVLSSMLWDIYKDKRSFYFHPLEKDTPYPRTMYVFSPKHLVKAFVKKSLIRITVSHESTRDPKFVPITLSEFPTIHTLISYLRMVEFCTLK